MKKVMLVAMLVMVSVVTACGKKDKKAPISPADRAARAAGGATAAHDLSLNGQVFFNDMMTEDEFQNSVKGLANASLPENYVGFVNGDYYSDDNKTGVLFGGRVHSDGGGAINVASNTSRVNISGTSRLLVVIYDEFVGQKDDKGQTIPAIPIYLTTSSGYIENKKAYLKFWDGYGHILLEGTVQSNGDFIGTFSYDNQKKYDGSGAGGAGELGTFVIRACSLFVCN